MKKSEMKRKIEKMKLRRKVCNIYAYLAFSNKTKLNLFRISGGRL